jgi:hypothetical protein
MAKIINFGNISHEENEPENKESKFTLRSQVSSHIGKTWMK